MRTSATNFCISTVVETALDEHDGLREKLHVLSLSRGTEQDEAHDLLT